MITGCFKNFFAMIGCFTLLLIAIVLTWMFWPQIKEAYEERFASHATVQVIERVA
jgi:cbb3-type cytochrome oxidase subunit 3